MTIQEEYDGDDYSEFVDCYECGGDGGRASCMSDCCPFEGGEEMCDEPACWRRCDICEGKGGWTREEPSTTQAAPDPDNVVDENGRAQEKK